MKIIHIFEYCIQVINFHAFVGCYSHYFISKHATNNFWTFEINYSLLTFYNIWPSPPKPWLV